MIVNSRCRQVNFRRVVAVGLIVGACITACTNDSNNVVRESKVIEEGKADDSLTKGTGSATTVGAEQVADGSLKKLLVDERGVLAATPRASVRIYKDQANAGDVDAQTRLGVCYYIGQGIEEDKGEAKKWFAKASEANDKKAQYCLAYLLEHGEGGPEDKREAFLWYQISAEGHDSYAKRSEDAVNRMSADFDAVEKERVRKEVLDWFKLSKQRKTKAEGFRRSY